MKTKKVTITLTDAQINKAKAKSKEIFGRENLSGFLAMLVEKHA